MAAHRFPPPWTVEELTKVVAQKRYGNLCSGNLAALVRREDADDFGTGDGFQYLSRVRARFRTRPDLPNPVR